MAEQITIDLKAEFGKLKQDLENVTTELIEIKQESAAAMKRLEKETKKTTKGVKGLAKAFKGIGTVLTGGALKLGAVLFEKIMEIFNKNQKVVDFFDTTMNSLQIVFNDFFSLIENNIGPITNYFKKIFDDPMQSLKNLGTALKNMIIERFKSSIEMVGHFATAIKKFVTGDWDGAIESVKEGGKEFVDTLTGVDGSFDKISQTAKDASKTIADYSKNTLKAAQDLTKLNKQSKLAEAQNALLLQQYDKEAELQRQIRDDVSLGIEERIAANKELGLVLDKQEKVMKSQAQKQLDAAEAALAIDKDNLDLQIAVIDKKREIADIEAAVTGFRAEQLTNENALEKERLDGIQAIKDQEAADLEAEKQQKEDKRIQDEKDHQAFLKQQEEKRKATLANLDTVIAAAGSETKIGRALFIAKQAMLVKEQIAAAKATLGQIALKGAEAGVDASAGFMKTAAKGFPANVPLLIAFAAQAAGIFASIKSAVSAAKGKANKMGAAGGGGVSLSAPRAQVSTPPAFNVVGSSQGSQIAQAINDQDKTPTRAFVVSGDVSTSQALDRAIIEEASIG